MTLTEDERAQGVVNFKQQDITAAVSSMDGVSPMLGKIQKCKITQLSTCIFPRVTDTLPLPLPLPLDDIIPQLLTVSMKEEVSQRKGEGTTEKDYVAGGKAGRSPFLRYGLMLGDKREGHIGLQGSRG